MAKETIQGKIESAPHRNNYDELYQEVSDLKGDVNQLNLNKAAKTEIIREIDLLASKVKNDTSGVAGTYVSNALLGLKQRIDNIIAQSGTSDTEVVDARYDAIRDITYSVLKDRLDADSEAITDTQQIIQNLLNQVGLRWNKTTDTYTRLGKAKGLTVDSSGSPNISDFDSIYPWSEMKRCNLASNRSVNAYYGDAGYIEDGTNGEVMVEIPQFYYKTNFYKDENNNEIFEWYISEFPQSGFKLHDAFIDNNIVSSHIYISAYEGYYDLTKLRSIADVQPTTDETIGTFRGYAQTNGTKWGLLDFTSSNCYTFLMLVEYADMNFQQNLSEGITNLDSGSGNYSQNTGHTSSLGNSSGEVVITSLENGATGASETYAFSYRGIENPYGNVWKFIDGVLIKDDGYYVGQDMDNYNDAGTNYLYIPTIPTTSDGYGSNFEKLNNMEYAFIPNETSGSTSTYTTDYLYAHDAGEVNIALLGGAWRIGLQAGAFYWLLLHVASYRIRLIGCRLFARK